MTRDQGSYKITELTPSIMQSVIEMLLWIESW